VVCQDRHPGTRAVGDLATGPRGAGHAPYPAGRGRRAGRKVSPSRPTKAAIFENLNMGEETPAGGPSARIAPRDSKRCGARQIMPDQSAPKVSEDAKWAYDLNRQHATREHDRIVDFATGANKAAIDSGHLALRTAVLVNGGAAAAVLAFIGSLVGQGKVPLGPQLNALTLTLVWFAVGVASATLGLGFVYFTNLSTVREANALEKRWEHPYIVTSAGSKRWNRTGNIARGAAVALGLGSAVFFIVGILAVRYAVTHLV
jgi:hypothetical protein